MSGVVQSGVSAAASPLKRAVASLKESYAAGGRAVTGGSEGGGSAQGASSGPPAWARSMKRSQAISQGASAAHNAIRAGDHPSSGSGIDLSEGE